MIVGHTYPNAVLHFEEGSREIAVTDRGRYPIIKHAVTIRFKKTWPGIPTTAIPTRYGSGRLQTILDTEKEAGRRGVEVGELDAWLREHKSWGVHMIEVNTATTDAIGDEGHGDGITATGEGGYHCSACDVYLKDGRGLTGHKRSKAHLQAVEALREPVAV